MRYYVLRFVTCYSLCLASLWTSIRSLKGWKLLAFQDYLYYPWVTDHHIACSTTCLCSSRANVKFYLGTIRVIHEHTSLGSSNETLYFNHMRYHDTSIESTYCYWLPLIVTQSIRNIWSAYNLINKSKSLLTLVQV